MRGEEIDPRLVLVKKNLSKVKNILAISSGKGGVGKSLTATVTSLIMANGGKRVGLFDLDFYGPSCLSILGAENIFPEEEKGLIPPTVNGIKLMSIEYFIKDNPLPIRGHEVTNAIIELLAVTVWGDLDYLVLDLPPGMGDEILDVIRLIPRTKHVIVSTPSMLSIRVVKRLIKLLKSINEEIIGVILNMVREDQRVDFGVDLIGKIRYDDKIDYAIGDPEKLLESDFAKDLSLIVEKINNSLSQK